MKAKAKSILKPMKDALMLSKAQERMRRKHGDAIKKASPPFYSSAECVEQEQHFTPAQIAKQWGVSSGRAQDRAEGQARFSSRPW